MDVTLLPKESFKKTIEYLLKENEELKNEIQKMKKEKIIFDGYQTPILKEMKLKANQ